MVRAAARGVVDFSQLNILDPVDSRRLRLLLQEVAADDNRTVLRAVHSHMTAGFSIDRITADSLNKLQQESGHILDDLLSEYQPWFYSAKSREEREREEFRELESAWNSRFGDLNDPETQKKLEAVRDALLADPPDPEMMSPSDGIFNKDTAERVTGTKALQSQLPR